MIRQSLREYEVAFQEYVIDKGLDFNNLSFLRRICNLLFLSFNL